MLLFLFEFTLNQLDIVVKQKCSLLKELIVLLLSDFLVFINYNQAETIRLNMLLKYKLSTKSKEICV